MAAWRGSRRPSPSGSRPPGSRRSIRTQSKGPGDCPACSLNVGRLLSDIFTPLRVGVQSLAAGQGILGMGNLLTDGRVALGLCLTIETLGQLPVGQPGDGAGFGE